MRFSKLANVLRKLTLRRTLPDFVDSLDDIAGKSDGKGDRLDEFEEEDEDKDDEHDCDISDSQQTPCDPDAVLLSLVFDISPSMDTADYQPTRLGAAKAAALKLVDRFSGMVCVIGFHASARQFCPFTSSLDGSAIGKAIRSMKTGVATNIAAGLKLANSAFAKHACSENKREVLLLSDGYNNTGGDPSVVADRLKRDGVLIRCVGIGGSPCQVDEATLKSIASKDDSGRPLYRFIADRDDLVQHFQDVGGLMR